jgi:hypothetical protein
MTEGQAVHQAREERVSDIIQKVEHPLRADYEYTLRRVDHRHPRRPTNFTRGENHSMINQHKICMFGPLSFTIIGFGITSKPIGTSQPSRIERTPLPHSCMSIGPTCKGSVILCSRRFHQGSDTWDL